MPHTLKVHYQKIRPEEGVMAHWGELGHALIRLKFSVSEFEGGMGNLKDLDSILRLYYQLQNYHTSTYELSERLFSFLASLTGQASKTTKRMLKDPNQQEKALAFLSKTAGVSTASLKRVLKALHDDTELRHISTHETFIRLAFNDGYHWVDIEDLWDLEEDAVAMGRAFKAVGKQGMRLVKEYKSRTEYIDKNLNVFLRAVLPYLCKLMV
jgi:hypothetical protein